MSTKRCQGMLQLLGAAVLVCTGCQSQPHSTTGGTAGVVHVGGKYQLPDVQVNVYEVGNKPQLIAFGVSGLDGRFELISPDGKSPVQLQPTEYAITLESIGPVPLFWKEPVQSVDKTPIRLKWQSTNDKLDLNVPEPRTAKAKFRDLRPFMCEQYEKD